MIETTFEQEKSKSIDLLCNIKCVNILMDIKKELNRDKLCIDCSSELTYLETNSYNKALEDVENFILNKIQELKN